MIFSDNYKKETIHTSETHFNCTKNTDFSKFLISWIECKVRRISDSIKEGKNLWIDIKTPIPIFYIEWSWWLRKWSYVKEKNIILMFDNADGETLKHEIIHSIEYNKPIPEELTKLYDLAKLKITEESFDGKIMNFNFKKNIHEFIADGYSKVSFINALKKELLYNDFLEKTKYIFE